MRVTGDTFRFVNDLTITGFDVAEKVGRGILFAFPGEDDGRVSGCF